MTAQLQLPDAEARRRIREDLETTFFVEAAAGTGKTTALVGRIVALLRAGAGTLDRVVAVTFTEKAAGELRLRLRAEIESARIAEPAGAPERHRLDDALEKLELARIGTIHGFCADLLHERPIEAGVDPLFQMAPEDEAERLLARAFDGWFQETLADPPEGVRRILRRRAAGPNALGPRDRLLGAARSLIEHRDFEAAWSRPPIEREAAIDGVMRHLEELSALAHRAEDPEDWLAKNLANVALFVGENALREDVRGRDYDALEGELRNLARTRRTGWHYKGRRRKWFAEGVARDDALARRDAAKEAIDEMLAAADADLAALLREELRPVVAAYEELKQRGGVLDFVDLLIRARDLLANDPVVRGTYQQTFSHFFVDEFQDTDPLQAEILLLLAADDPEASDWRSARPAPGKLFLVGDPKQSIYRFRRADVAIYEATKRRLVALDAEVLHLTASFRATPSLQAAVNAAFAPHMRGAEDGSQAEYVALEPVREEVLSRPSFVALPVPRPYGDYGSVVHWKIDDSLPEAVGAFVQWLVEKSGWTVDDGSGAPVPVAPRHVCLLFRRFKNFGDDVTRGYVRALEARRVPHVLVGGRSFHDREEVLAIRNALCAIEWPDDELRVFATLRGPLFALGDDALLTYRHRRGSLHPLRPALEDAGDEEREVADALAVLRGLHNERNRRPLADTIARLLEAVRAHAGIAIWPTGEQALANCLRTIDRARRFERRGAPSFRAFVEHLEAEAERGDAEDAPVVEEGTEGVRIMTAHRAKGLEFPVVVLCDPTCRATRDQPSRHVDPERGLWAEPLCGCAPADLLQNQTEELRRDAAEAVRLAYVAATRARDLLVVPVVADKEQENGWLSVLNDVVYPGGGSPGEAEPAPGCPPFGKEAIEDRPYNARRERASVAPGRLRPREGRHHVVWWDPNVLALAARNDVGIRQQRILEADEQGVIAERGVRAHERWQEARRETLERGGLASLSVTSVTRLAATHAEEERGATPLEVIEVDGARGDRPSGARFGTLVHAALAAVDLDASPESIEAVTRLQGRIVGAPEDEVAAARRAVGAALAHSVLSRAAGSDALRRETPVLLRLDDGSLAEGIVDLAFRETADAGAIWTVVDFKTDRDVETRRAEYEAQVRLYVDAVSRATGEPARGLLLVV